MYHLNIGFRQDWIQANVHVIRPKQNAVLVAQNARPGQGRPIDLGFGASGGRADLELAAVCAPDRRVLLHDAQAAEHDLGRRRGVLAPNGVGAFVQEMNHHPG